MIDRFALLIGGMRCGSTSLFNYLAQHPEIAACSDKEPAYFSNDEKWERGLDWYRGLWKWAPAHHRIALEASTNYSKVQMFPETAARIASTPGDFRFIYVMRDPIARLESHYTLAAAKGWREAEQPLAAGVHPDLIDVSRYATQLDPFRDRFGADRILLLAFEDVSTRPAEAIASVCRFLDVDPDFRFQGLDFVHNSNVGRRPGEMGQVLYRYRKLVPGWTRLSRRISPRQRARLQRWISRGDRAAPLLSDEQRAAIRAELADEMRRLRDEWSFDTSRWPGVQG